MGERSETLVRLWRRVNELADIEDSKTIRLLIAEAGIEPGAHVGADPDTFTDDMVAEWVLGQWADMIDHGSPFLNSARNISFHQFERLHGPVKAAGGSANGAWFASEVTAVVEKRPTVAVVVPDDAARPSVGGTEGDGS